MGSTRVGMFDGRHPNGYDAALEAVRRVLTPQWRLFVDDGPAARHRPWPTS